MPKLTVDALKIPGPLLITPAKFEDERGYFMETFNAPEFALLGVDATFVQDNQSYSKRAGTVRGLHFQTPPQPQAKLVRALSGSIFDVAVDLRQGSRTYGEWCAVTLTADDGRQLFIPRGFAHGFCTLEPDTVVAYKVDGLYSAAADSGLFWADPDLGVRWPVSPDDAILSQKDARLPRFRDFASPFAA